MVSFKELHEADFSGVSEAAEAWAGVAKALTDLDGRVTKDLTSTAQRAGWKGDAADAATTAMQGIDGDFKQASAVATALAAIMKTAAEDFAAARHDLDTAIHDAQAENMTVSADGQVNWTLPKEAQNDTDREKLAQGLKAKAEAIAARFTKALEKAGSADQRASVALQGDVGTSSTSFNPAPYGGGPVADANRAKDLMSKAGSLSDDQLKQLQALMAANADNKDFSTTLLNGLDYGGKTGPDALLEYSKVYDGLAHGNHNAKGYQNVYGNLSVALATATRDGGMGKAWEDGLLAAARRPGGMPTGYNEDYPALTTLMGAGGTYDKSFLLKVGNDLVDYERTSKTKGEALWGPNWDNPGKQSDPVGGLMNALSHNPEASKDFFDPGRTKNLDYMLHERKWPLQGNEQNLPADFASSRTAFGYALEAATTGRDPHGDQPVVRPHDKVMSQIADETMKTFAGSGPADKTSLPAGLRRPMADMIADYSADMHEILGKDLYGASQPDGLTVNREQLLRLIRGTAEDPAAFAVIQHGETQEIARLLDESGPDVVKPDATGGANRKLDALIHESGRTLGALDAVYADAAVDHADAEKSTQDWQAKMNYHLVGTPANLIPGVGDIAQRYVDIGTAKYAEAAKAEIDARFQDNLSSHFSAGQQQLKAMIDHKMIMSGVDHQTMDLKEGVPQQLKRTVERAYNDGIDSTYRSVFGRA